MLPRQGYRIWPVLPSASGNLSLRAGFGAAIQGRMDQYGDMRPWVATPQTLPAMTKGGKCECPGCPGLLT